MTYIREIIIGVLIVLGYFIYTRLENSHNKVIEKLNQDKELLQTQLIEIKRTNDSIIFYISNQINTKDKLLDNIATKAIILKPKYEYIKDIKPEYDDSILLFNSGSIINFPIGR